MQVRTGREGSSGLLGGVASQRALDTAEHLMTAPDGAEIDRGGASGTERASDRSGSHHLQRRLDRAGRCQPPAHGGALGGGKTTDRQPKDVHAPNRPKTPTFRQPPSSIGMAREVSPYGCRSSGSYSAEPCKRKEGAHQVSTLRTAATRSLPVVPAPAFRAADEESEHPEDQPDDQHNPEDVKRRCQQATSTEKQQQQDQNDQRNHS